MTIKQLREERELTQQQVADKMGIDIATYNRYERGKYPMSKKVILALSAVFKVSPSKIDIK